MKNLKGVYNREANKFKPKCNPLPGFSDSCNKCKDCNRRRRFEEEEYPPMEIGYELREDGSIELREDGFIELRQH